MEEKIKDDVVYIGCENSQSEVCEARFKELDVTCKSLANMIYDYASDYIICDNDYITHLYDSLIRFNSVEVRLFKKE